MQAERKSIQEGGCWSNTETLRMVLEAMAGGRDWGSLHLFGTSFLSLERVDAFVTDCTKSAGSAWRF